MAISSINPTLPNPERKMDRHTAALEITGDETIGKAVVDGARKYKAMLRKSLEDAGDNGETHRPQQSFDNIRYLEAFLSLNMVRDLPKQVEKMKTTMRGAKEAYVIMGQNVPRDGNPVKQIEVKARVEGAASINESNLAASYHGQSPERIVMKSGSSITPIRVSVMFKDVSYSSEDDAIKVEDSTGISIGMTRDGDIIEVQGVTSKFGQYHYTENLMSDIDLAHMGNIGGTLDVINEFVQ